MPGMCEHFLFEPFSVYETKSWLRMFLNFFNFKNFVSFSRHIFLDVCLFISSDLN